MFETYEKKDDGLWNEIFAEVDKNGDGEITYEEFSESMKKVIGNNKEQNAGKLIYRTEGEESTKSK
jgi:Ca2+-binding EF-hand superfamily protein